jgi:hypothetical protein
MGTGWRRRGDTWEDTLRILDDIAPQARANDFRAGLSGTPLVTDLVELRFLGFFTCLRWRRLRQPLINYLKYLWAL